MKSDFLLLVLAVMIMICFTQTSGGKTAVAEKPPYAKVEFCGSLTPEAVVLYQVADLLNKVCTQVNSISCSDNIENFFGAEQKEIAINRINEIFCKSEIRLSNCWSALCVDTVAYNSEGYYYTSSENSTFVAVQHDERAVGKKKVFQFCPKTAVNESAVFSFPQNRSIIIDLFQQLAKYSRKCQVIEITDQLQNHESLICAALLSGKKLVDTCVTYPYFMFNSIFTCDTLMIPDCPEKYYYALDHFNYSSVGSRYDFGEKGVYYGFNHGDYAVESNAASPFIFPAFLLSFILMLFLM